VKITQWPHPLLSTSGLLRDGACHEECFSLSVQGQGRSIKELKDTFLNAGVVMLRLHLRV